MDTLIVNNATKKDLALLIDIAEKIGIDVEIVPQKNTPKKSKKKTIADLSKKINKTASKRLFKKMGVAYDSNSRY